jgi:YfiH family protein
MDPFILKEKEYFTIYDWVQQFSNLTAGFTTKNGGKSKGAFTELNLGFHVGDQVETVCKNRTLLANQLSFPLNNWVGAEQTHEIAIKKVTKADKGIGARDYSSAFKRIDGFFTLEKNVLLTLCYADCVPLYFLHPDSGAIGIAHAGWRGTVGGIAAEMIKIFQSEGIKTNEILAAIGPSICEKCYIVDDHVIDLVKNGLEDVEKNPYNKISDGQYQLDLKECNKQILLKAGLSPEHILVTQLCSSCEEDQFFSHRRDEGKTGRMMSFIGWKEADL